MREVLSLLGESLKVGEWGDYDPNTFMGIINNTTKGPRLKGICISRCWEGGTVGSPRGVGEWGDYDPNILTGIIK